MSEDVENGQMMREEMDQSDMFRFIMFTDSSMRMVKISVELVFCQ